MIQIPHELDFAGIFLPPMLVASILGLIATVFTANLLNHFRLSQNFANPPLVFVAMVIIYSILIGTFFIGV